MLSALGPAALRLSGTHIRQSPHARVTSITQKINMRKTTQLVKTLVKDSIKTTTSPS